MRGALLWRRVSGVLILVAGWALGGSVFGGATGSAQRAMGIAIGALATLAAIRVGSRGGHLARVYLVLATAFFVLAVIGALTAK